MGTINGQRHHFELQNERVLVPELLFDHEASDDNPTLPELVVNCGAAALAGGHCDAEGARRLFRQIVLVGGAADIPGIRPRTEHEVRALIRNGRAPQQLLEAVTDPNDIFVLNPPRTADGPLTSPRFVPFVGGCVRAVSSERLLPLTPSALAERQVVAPQLSGFREWLTREVMNLDGPALFRTGGGGGADDGVWHALRLALAHMHMRDVHVEETHEEDDSNDDLD